MVDPDQFRRHLGNHLQQVALFSLPRLSQDHDQSLGPHDGVDIPDRDKMSRGCRWIRDDCGHGWSIVSRKRTTFIALISFLNLWQAHRVSKNQLALEEASAQGDEKLVRLLLDQGTKVNFEGQSYGSALYKAVSRGHESIVQLLLEKARRMRRILRDDSNALTTVSYMGHEEVVRLLLDKGADVNAQGGYYGNALQAAAWSGNEKVVRLLIDHGADANVSSIITVNALNTDHNLLIGLHYSIAYLKDIIRENIPSVKEEVGPYGSFTLIYDDKLLEDESRSCREEGIGEGSRLLCRFDPWSPLSGEN